MGLLDLSDEQRYGLLMAAAQMMQPGAGGTSGAVGRGLMSGLQGYQGALALKDRRAEEAQQRDFRQMQMGQMRQQQENQRGLLGAATTAFAQPNLNQGVTQNDDMGSPIPQVPGGGGMPEFMKLGAPYMSAEQIVSMNQKAQPKYHVVNGALVPEPAPGQTSSTPAYEAPREQWLDAGKDPRTGQALQKNSLTGQLRAVGGVGPSVTVNNVGEREEQKKLGELRVKNFGDLQGAANSARREISLLSGLEKIPLETGKLTPANATVAAWLTAAGAKNEDLKRIASGGQTFEAFTNDLVMQQQLAQKGPQTESDAKRLEATQAQLSNTPEANQLNIAFRKASAKRIVEQERFYADYARKNKGTLDGADDAWFNGKGGKSIWDEPELKKFQKTGPSGGRVIDFNDLPR